MQRSAVQRSRRPSTAGASSFVGPLPESRARAERELDLQTIAGARRRCAASGYAARRGRRRTTTQGAGSGRQAVDDARSCCPALHGLWPVLFVRTAAMPEQHEAGGEQLSDLAASAQTGADCVRRSRTCGRAARSWPAPTARRTRAHLEQGAALYDPGTARLDGLSLRHRPRCVGALPHLTWVHVAAGLPGSGVSPTSARALALAQRACPSDRRSRLLWCAAPWCVPLAAMSAQPRTHAATCALELSHGEHELPDPVRRSAPVASMAGPGSRRQGGARRRGTARGSRAGRISERTGSGSSDRLFLGLAG